MLAVLTTTLARLGGRPRTLAAPPCVGRLLLLSLAAGAGASAGAQPAAPAPTLQSTAAFYWQYAPLAADVYRTGGVVDTKIPIALSSPWLRAEVNASGRADIKSRFESLDGRSAEELYRRLLQARCDRGSVPTLQAGARGAATLDEAGCVAGDTGDDDDDDLAQLDAETNRFETRTPLTADDCESGKGREPAVPVEAATRELGWERVPELHRQTSAKGWSVFVPDLAIDVWRRQREPEGRPVVEYAIVYRGTIGGGGWVSNLRALTAFTPFVWDQYRQARKATESVIDQIYKLHTLSDAIFVRAVPTRVLVTTVGHSLGAGLAKYLYLRLPQVTRVVGFNPSPVDGSSTIDPFKGRSRVMAGLRHAIDRDPRDPAASMFLLFEQGEVLTRIAPCVSGPVWGDEGGPHARCDSVNLSRGSWVRQHNMAQLACKLYLARDGKIG